VRISPLRLWLQSTSLLAVLAGYSLLLLANQRIAGFDRTAAHRQTVQQLGAELERRATSSDQLQPLLASSLLPNLRLSLLPADAPASDAQPLQRGDQAWLVSQRPLQLADGSSAGLLVEQDVSASVRREGLNFWLLLVAAGGSSLFTSALLRLVLHRGLVRPLREFTAQLSATPVPPAPGDPLNVAAQPEELQPIAVAYNQQHQRLCASWERQRAFVDGVAHELRTPITLISGHAQGLLRRPPQPAALLLIQQEAQRMGTLVTDLLDLARNDSGRLHLRRQPLQADDVLLALYERMAPQAAGRLRLQACAEAPTASGDPHRLQQCLTALVDNALLYSPAPSPVTLAASTGPAGELVLHVRDRGPGVPIEEREAIFGRFVRGSAGLASPRRGSGIGLSVVRLLIEAMGGRVQVADQPGGGADFQLLLPGLAGDRVAG
jgi:two-component system OmpR family sensor kinase